MLTTTETIQPQQKLAIDLASTIAKLGADPTGAFAEGSVAVYFMGTIMPVAGQMTVTNPALSLTHQVDMVENDPGRSDVPAVLNGAWWGLGGGNSAQVFVSNTSNSAQMAQVYLDFAGKQHAIKKPLTFVPYETKVLDIAQLLASIGVDPANAPAGGITIIQAGPHPALIAGGKITDPATGFSSTIDFPDPQLQLASAVHAVGLPIGVPTKDSPFARGGYFIPHVVVRNLLATPQTVTITVEYPVAAVPSPPGAAVAAASGRRSLEVKAGAQRAPLQKKIIRRPPLPGDKDLHPEWGAGTGSTTGNTIVASFSVAGYSAEDFSLSAVMSQLPLPLPFCSIRIQYSGAPGSMIADVSSVEQASNMVVDAKAENEGNGWAGSGANPWHVDKDTDSVLFLTDMSDKVAHIGLEVTASGIHYYLTELKLNPHETRAINIRALRDAQLAGFKGHKIPADATDGSINWVRADDVPVMGRLMVINHRAGMAISYDCTPANCPLSVQTIQLQPFGDFAPNTSQQGYIIATEENCNESQYFLSWAGPCWWSSDDTEVATVSSTGYVTGVAGGGSAYILVSATTKQYSCEYARHCALTTSTKTSQTAATVTVTVQISSVTVAPPTMHTSATPNQATVTVDMTYTSVASNLTTLPTVTLNVETYTTSIPGAALSYTPASQTVTLSPGTGGPAVRTCTVFGASAASSFVIQAVLNNGSAGVVVENPSPATAARAALSVVAP